MSIGEMTLEDAAKEAAGNWRRFSSFVWFREREITDPENWAVIYTHNRDSGLLDQSNAQQIAEALEAHTEGDDPDVVGNDPPYPVCYHGVGYPKRGIDPRRLAAAPLN